MQEQEILIYPDRDTFYGSASRVVVQELNAALARSGRAGFVLTGGSTPRPLYERLAKECRDSVDWSRVEFFWGDERCVPPDSPESNYGMTRKSLLESIPVVAEKVHRMQGELAPADEAARLYEEEVRRFAGSDAIPSFDLVLLGMGDDGHTASLFPGTSWDPERWVVANFVPKLNAHRITMTPRLLNAARRLVFLVTGHSKAEPLASALQNPNSSLPVKSILLEEGRLTWMLDAEAASLLNIAPGSGSLSAGSSEPEA